MTYILRIHGVSFLNRSAPFYFCIRLRCWPASDPCSHGLSVPCLNKRAPPPVALLCVGVCSPPPPAAEQWPPAACAWRPALRPWAPWWFWVRHPQGAWAESVRAGLMFKLASERPRAGQGPGCLSRLPRLPVWPPAGVAGSRSPCHPCPCLCVRRARCHQKGVSRSGGSRTSPALPLGPLLWARLWSQQAAGLRDACEESLKRVRGHAAQGWVSPWQKPSASGAASPQAGQAPGPGSCHPTAAPNPGPA